MADLIFNKFLEYMADGTIDMDNDTFKCALFTNEALPAATVETFGSLLGSKTEVSGSGYTASGEALTSVTWAESGGTVTFDADDVAWTSATFDARYAVIYSDSAANDALVCLIDFGSEKSVSGGTFTIQFNASGIITAAQS